MLTILAKIEVYANFKSLSDPIVDRHTTRLTSLTILPAVERYGDKDKRVLHLSYENPRKRKCLVTVINAVWDLPLCLRLTARSMAGAETL